MDNKSDIHLDTSEVERNLQNFIKQKLPEALKKGMEKACLVVEADAKKKCPSKTGNLRASITHKVEEETDEIKGYVGSNLEYAPYVHQGTGIYAIEGNGRKDVPWVFMNDKGEYVKTEGIKPTPFITDAVEEDRDKIIQSFDGVLGK